MKLYPELNEILLIEDINNRFNQLQILLNKNIESKKTLLDSTGVEYFKKEYTPYIDEEDKLNIIKDQIILVVKKFNVPIIIDIYGIKTYDTTCTSEDFMLLCKTIRLLVDDSLNEIIAGKFYL